MPEELLPGTTATSGASDAAEMENAVDTPVSLGGGLLGWVVYALAVAGATWWWRNPWVTGVLIAILAIPISRVVHFAVLRFLVVIGLAIGAFVLVSNWNVATYQVVDAVGIGPVRVGMTVAQLQVVGFPDASPDSLVEIPGLEHAYAHLNQAGAVEVLAVDSSGDYDAPKWTTRDGLGATSTIEDFVGRHPDAVRYDDASGWSVAWVQSGDTAMMLTSYRPGKGLLQVGTADAIAAAYAEAIKPEPTVTTTDAGVTGYGWDQAYSDAKNGCLGEAQSENGTVASEDETFCDSYARSLADQYCTQDACTSPGG